MYENPYNTHLPTDQENDHYAEDAYTGSQRESIGYDVQVEGKIMPEQDLDRTAQTGVTGTLTKEECQEVRDYLKGAKKMEPNKPLDLVIPEKTTTKELILKIEKKKEEYLITRGLAVLHLKAGVHYGPPWPGSQKDNLYLAGAEAVNALMLVRVSSPRVRDKIFDLDKGFFLYDFEVDLINKETGNIEATGIGSCNSWEDKYRYRNVGLQCPICNKETIKKSKWADKSPEKGWYCYQKIGGCGAQFHIQFNEITSQKPGKVENDNPANQLHTIQSIAHKRAHLKATRLHACLSNTFSQDGEDFSRTVVNVTPDKMPEKTEPKALPPPEDKLDDAQEDHPSDYLGLVPDRVKFRGLVDQACELTGREQASIITWAFDEKLEFNTWDQRADAQQLFNAISKVEDFIEEYLSKRGAKEPLPNAGKTKKSGKPHSKGK